MKKMSLEEYESLTAGARLIREDMYGERVWLTPDQLFIKLFLLKRIFSSALFYPYALRFRRNTIQLRKLGIPTVCVKDIYYLPARKRYVMIYPMLQGVTLREHLAEQKDAHKTIGEAARFLAELHNKGVYFRAVHFGNILVLPNGRFGLIDVDAMTIKRSSLGPWRRVRNFKHFFKYDEDYSCIRDFDLAEFFKIYLANSDLSPLNIRWFLKLLIPCNPRLSNAGEFSFRQF